MLRVVTRRCATRIFGRSKSGAYKSSLKELPPKVVSFSGSGWLVGFHFGAAQTLLDRELITNSTIVAGASGGSLVAAALACDVDLNQAIELYRAEAAVMLRNGSWYRGGNTDMLYKVLRAFVPEDAAAICRDRLVVAVQEVSLTAPPEHIKDFTSKDDLIEALITSCHIPLYLDGRLTRQFRGQTRVDGGLKHMVPRLDVPLRNTITVCPLPTWVSNATGEHVDIGPYLVPGMVNDPEQLAMAFKPPNEEQLQRLCKQGSMAAEAYLQRMQAETA
eukprot:TRINITY_DN6252_c0_g1_i1.p1 TRINITY_DN6252_c0_g1~~TRINITY_DN6252_c0_g1_i1.p1  ORF type:complete len:275 (+),score=53.94 TRINITY_DN6252_c0_g1_i1:145-969(+)